MSIGILWSVARDNVQGLIKKNISEVLASKNEYVKKLKKEGPLYVVTQGLKQIPLVGTFVAPVFKWGLGKVFTKKSMRSLRSELSGEGNINNRLNLATQVLELEVMSKIRINYTRVVEFFSKEWDPPIKDCASATAAAEACVAAGLCLDELKDWLAVVRTFANDLESEIERLDEELRDSRKARVTTRASHFFQSHTEECVGNKGCYLILAKDKKYEGTELMPMKKKNEG